MKCFHSAPGLGRGWWGQWGVQQNSDDLFTKSAAFFTAVLSQITYFKASYEINEIIFVYSGFNHF